jgi:hypothetical protein
VTYGGWRRSSSGGHEDLHIKDTAAELSWDLHFENIRTPVQESKGSGSAQAWLREPHLRRAGVASLKEDKNKSLERRYARRSYYAYAQLLAEYVARGIKTDSACKKLLQKIAGRVK